MTDLSQAINAAADVRASLVCITHVRLCEVATIENAVEWLLAVEKYTHCIDLLGISAHWRFADVFVNDLEDAFDALIATAREGGAV
jgi:hypothetical protein